MTRTRKVLLALACAVAGAVAYLLLWPVELDPAAWDPPEAPALVGDFEVNDALAAVQRIPIGGDGPEDVAVDAQGRILGGTVDGRIRRVWADGTHGETFADTGGRPLGLHFDAQGNLLVADARKGLLSVAPDGTVSVLATEHDGLRLGFTDDVDVAPDGTVYFSDASYRWDVEHVREDALEHRPYGRLLAWDPTTRETRLILDELYFANGVAVAPDGSFVLVNETTAYRTLRHWLTGPDAGKTEVLIENLPGLPDGVSAGSEGRFWIALYAPRVPALDATLPHPWLRKVIYRLPRILQPDPVMHGMVLAVDGSGRVVHNLQHAGPDPFAPITSVQEHGGMLYLGSLTYPAVARLPVPAAPQ